MDPARAPRRPRARLPLLVAIAGTVALRLATARPPLIDDDEAWFAISGYSTPSPAAAMRSVIDNKPPGTTWFYWLVAHAFGSGHLPQKARIVQALLLLASSGLIAGIARKIAPRANPLAIALLYLLTLGAAGPKLFSVTNEGLMLPWLLLGFYLVWPWEGMRRSRIAAFASGVALAAAILIKQTGIVFLIPWLFALAPCAGSVAPAIFGLVAALASGIATAGPHAFWHWAFAYPAATLRSARESLFSVPGELFPNVALFALALLPVAAALPRSLIHSWHDWRERRNAAARALFAWLAAALAAVAAGKGLFMHYFLLLAPPLCLLLAAAPSIARIGRRGWIWLGAFYLASAAIAASGVFGVFWGNDLPYFERASARIRAITAPDARVFVWGGSVAPLALSGRRALPGFPTSRFATPPYATPELKKLFLARFETTEPELVVDLHLRGDNRFRQPLESFPQLARIIGRDYERWADPALPWAYFYLRKRESSSSGFERFGLCRAHSPGRSGIAAQLSVAAALRYGWQHWESWPALDLDLRAGYALAWAKAACAQAPPLFSEALPGISPRKLAALFRRSGYATPFPVADPLWWASLAVVELQPGGYADTR